MNVSRQALNDGNVERKTTAHIASLCFLALALILFVAMWLASANPVAVVSFERDIWHHLAVYSELIASPFEAANPHVATTDPSRSYSPWTVVIAVLSQQLDSNPFTAIWIAGSATIFAFLYGVYAFARSYWSSPWAPTILLLVLISTWIIPQNHTGYHTLSTFVFSLSYPFGIVLAAGLLTWALVIRAVDRGASVFTLATACFLAWFMFITHQLQGLFAIGGAIGFAFFYGRAPFRRRGALVLSLLAGLILTHWWLYFDPIAFVLKPEVQAGHDAVRYLSYRAENIDRLLLTLGGALVGVLGFWDLEKRRPRWELFLPCAAILVGFVVLTMKGSWVNVRIVPFLTLYLQLGLVALLLSLQLASVKVLASALLLVGLTANVRDAHHDYFKAFRFLESGIGSRIAGTWSPFAVSAMYHVETLAPSGSVVIAHRQTAFPMEASSHSVVAIPRLFAEVPDMLERQTDNRAFFAAGTTQEARCDLLAKYNVSVIAYRDVWLENGVAKELHEFGRHEPFGDVHFVVPVEGHRFGQCGVDG